MAAKSSSRFPPQGVLSPRTGARQSRTSRHHGRTHLPSVLGEDPLGRRTRSASTQPAFVPDLLSSIISLSGPRPAPAPGQLFSRIRPLISVCREDESKRRLALLTSRCSVAPLPKSVWYAALSPKYS